MRLGRPASAPAAVNRNASVTDQPYKSDFLTNYEVGWKTSWLDNTMHFNGALFWDKWKDFQFSYLGPNSLTVIANVGNADIKGVEADLNWRATEKPHADRGGHLYRRASGGQVLQTMPSSCPVIGDAPGRPAASDHGQVQGERDRTLRFKVDGYDGHVQAALAYQGPSWADLRSVRARDHRRAEGLHGGELRRRPRPRQLDGGAHHRQRLRRARPAITCYSECKPTVCGPETYIIPNRPRTIAIHFGQKF